MKNRRAAIIDRERRIHHSSVVYLVSTALLCVVLILAVGSQLNLINSELLPASSMGDRFRYAWSEFVSNFVSEFSLFQQTMDFTAGSQPGENHKSVAVFTVMLIQYFYLSRMIDRFLKGKSYIDKALCFLGGCFLQASLSMMCFTYSDQEWKCLMFYCYVITLVGVAGGTLISYVIAVIRERTDAFRTNAAIKHNGRYYVIKVLKILFNPFVRGYYAAVFGFCVVTLIYVLVYCAMLHVTSNENLIALLLFPLSYGLNKLSEYISKKILVWKGEKPDKLTMADKIYYSIAIFFIVFWFLTVVFNVQFPEYWDWMYENLDCMKMMGNAEYYKSLY